MYAVTKTVYGRAVLASEGGKTEYSCTQNDPRYRFRNQTLIDLLEITPSEERQQKMIISDGTKRERDRIRKETAMREAGASARPDYLAAATGGRQTASDFRLLGLSYRAIAEKMGLTRKQGR